MSISSRRTASNTTRSRFLTEGFNRPWRGSGWRHPTFPGLGLSAFTRDYVQSPLTGLETVDLIAPGGATFIAAWRGSGLGAAFPGLGLSAFTRGYVQTPLAGLRSNTHTSSIDSDGAACPKVDCSIALDSWAGSCLAESSSSFASAAGHPAHPFWVRERGVVPVRGTDAAQHLASPLCVSQRTTRTNFR